MSGVVTLAMCVIGDRAAKSAGVLPRRTAEPLRLREPEVGGEPETVPVGDRALRHRGGKPRRLGDDPVGENAAAASAGHAEAFFVDVALAITASTPAIKSW
jgi:hypothetical protein